MSRDPGHVRPSRLRKQRLAEQVLEARRLGMSYRAIGTQLGISYSYAQQVCVWAYREHVTNLADDARVALGEELSRLDGVIRFATREMYNSAEARDRIRAAELVRRTAETKIKVLGVGAPERVQIEGLTVSALVATEVAGMSDEEIDRELADLGYERIEDADVVDEAHQLPSPNGNGHP